MLFIRAEYWTSAIYIQLHYCTRHSESIYEDSPRETMLAWISVKYEQTNINNRELQVEYYNPQGIHSSVRSLHYYN